MDYIDLLKLSTIVYSGNISEQAILIERVQGAVNEFLRSYSVSRRDILTPVAGECTSNNSTR